MEPRLVGVGIDKGQGHGRLPGKTNIDFARRELFLNSTSVKTIRFFHAGAVRHVPSISELAQECGCLDTWRRSRPVSPFSRPARHQPPVHLIAAYTTAIFR